MLPLGNTLHYIDKNVDYGEIISIVSTPIFITDSLETLARRHYENEVKILSSYNYYIDKPQNNYTHISIQESTMRMPIDIETKMVRIFDLYKEKYALPYLPLNFLNE